MHPSTHLRRCRRHAVQPDAHDRDAIPGSNRYDANRHHASAGQHDLLRGIVPGDTRTGGNDGTRELRQFIDANGCDLDALVLGCGRSSLRFDNPRWRTATMRVKGTGDPSQSNANTSGFEEQPKRSEEPFT